MTNHGTGALRVEDCYMRYPRSCKKDKPDLSRLREEGYKITLWHGEGDTLYIARRRSGKNLTTVPKPVRT